MLGVDSTVQNGPVLTRTFAALEIGRRVKQALSDANMPGLRRISIEVRRDTVILQGEVCSFYERQTAITRVARVPGVLRIVDMLQVRLA